MSTVAELPSRLREAVQKEFQGEAIRWVGRPSARRAFAASLLIWLFAIPWTAFSPGWEWAALASWFSGKPSPSPSPSPTHTSGVRQQAFDAILAIFGEDASLVAAGVGPAGRDNCDCG